MGTAGPVAPIACRRRRPGKPGRGLDALLVPTGVVVTAVLGWQQRWITDDGLCRS
ncbi:MAG TPA: hypothetical protein VE709_07885 [Pseudonocardiaceae bacterium]|nr:hypothetical protein [Pseudonocardiaceae bacterium]